MNLNNKLIPTALAAALLLAGCSLIPTYERPAAPVPTTYPGDPAQPAPGRRRPPCPGRTSSPTRARRA